MRQVEGRAALESHAPSRRMLFGPIRSKHSQALRSVAKRSVSKDGNAKDEAAALERCIGTVPVATLRDTPLRSVPQGEVGVQPSAENSQALKIRLCQLARCACSALLQSRRIKCVQLSPTAFRSSRCEYQMRRPISMSDLQGCASFSSWADQDGSSLKVKWLKSAEASNPFVLVLLEGTSETFGGGHQGVIGPLSHFGFAVDSRAEVDNVANDAQAAGVLLTTPRSGETARL